MSRDNSCANYCIIVVPTTPQLQLNRRSCAALRLHICQHKVKRALAVSKAAALTSRVHSHCAATQHEWAVSARKERFQFEFKRWKKVFNWMNGMLRRESDRLCKCIHNSLTCTRATTLCWQLLWGFFRLVFPIALAAAVVNHFRVPELKRMRTISNFIIIFFIYFHRIKGDQIRDDSAEILCSFAVRIENVLDESSIQANVRYLISSFLCLQYFPERKRERKIKLRSPRCRGMKNWLSG